MIIMFLFICDNWIDSRAGTSDSPLQTMLEWRRGGPREAQSTGFSTVAWNKHAVIEKKEKKNIEKVVLWRSTFKITRVDKKIKLHIFRLWSQNNINN